MRTYIPRASRIELQIPVRYRVTNGQDWLQTNVVNMSESGILFGPTSLHEGTEIEMIVSIPKSIRDLPAGSYQLAVYYGEVTFAHPIEIVDGKLTQLRIAKLNVESARGEIIEIAP